MRPRKGEEMNSQYTAIYTDSWMSGSHRHTLTRMRRIEQRDGETVADMLKREDIADCTVFLFHGHAPLQGEKITHNAELSGATLAERPTRTTD